MGLEQGFTRHHMQGIPEDGEVVVPLLVHGGMTAAEGRLVHDVVVHQGEIVEEFHSQGRRLLVPGFPHRPRTPP